MISKEEYVLNRVKSLLHHKAKNNKRIKPLSLISVIEQWEFDYEMEKEYRSEILKAEGGCGNEDY